MIEANPPFKPTNKRALAVAGRDQAGRFTSGNKASPGRPPKAIEDQYLQALRRSVSLKDFEAIVRRAVLDAKKGNKSAREWISRYCVDLAIEARLERIEEQLRAQEGSRGYGRY